MQKGYKHNRKLYSLSPQMRFASPLFSYLMCQLMKERDRDALDRENQRDAPIVYYRAVWVEEMKSGKTKSQGERIF